jgi:hypothetical protein
MPTTLRGEGFSRGGGVTEGASAAAVFTPNECCGGRELSESVIEFNLANQPIMPR